MEIRYNCGISSKEIFTNVPQKVVKYDVFTFNEKTNSDFKRIEECAGTIFTAALKVIIDRVIRDKVRFVTNYANSYIDFETVEDPFFMQQRQMGRFKDIDIVESDFKGYHLAYYYRVSFGPNKRYKKHPIYVNKSTKKPFIDRINTGEVFYTTENIRTKDIVDDVKEYFPKITKAALASIIEYGFTRMYYAVRQLCTVSAFNVPKDIYVYIGPLYKNREKWVKEYYFRLRMKLFRIYKWQGYKITNVYYIAMTEEKMIEWAKMNDKSNRAGWTWVWFNKVMLRSIKQVALSCTANVHIFRVKAKKKDTKRSNIWLKEPRKFREVEYLGRGKNFKLIPSNDHWKDLVKEYRYKEINNEERNY